MQKALCLLIVLLLLPCCAFAQDVFPEWTYAIDPLILKNTNGYLTLANREHLLDASYIPDDLVDVTARQVSGDFQLRAAVNEALEQLFDAAQADGCTLYVKSAYRSYQTQKTMYYNRLQKNGYDDGWVSFPGASDHQTGLGVDVLNYAWTKKDGMNEKFALEKEAKWMAEHCHEYGFIIRYMKDKQSITGISYEPWHLRYVGLEAAAYIMENHLSLEEFTEEWQAYVAAFEVSSCASFEEYCRFLRILPPARETGEYGLDGDSEISLFYN